MTWLGSGSRAGSHCRERVSGELKKKKSHNETTTKTTRISVRGKWQLWKGEQTLTDILVSLLRMTWRRWGGSIGGALKCSSGLKMYCSCPYGPGGELDRSANTQESKITLLISVYFELKTTGQPLINSIHKKQNWQMIKNMWIWNHSIGILNCFCTDD